MTGHLPLFVVAGVLLVAGPEAGHAAPPDDQAIAPPQLSDAEALSAVAGKIIGAATMCDQIGRDRVSAATNKAAELVSGSASDASEIASAQQLFAKNAAIGKAAVQRGAADCR